MISFLGTLITFLVSGLVLFPIMCLYGYVFNRWDFRKKWADRKRSDIKDGTIFFLIVIFITSVLSEALKLVVIVVNRTLFP